MSGEPGKIFQDVFDRILFPFWPKAIRIGIEVTENGFLGCQPEVNGTAPKERLDVRIKVYREAMTVS